MGEPERDWNLPCNEDSDNLRARAKRTRKRGVVEERERRVWYWRFSFVLKRLLLFFQKKKIIIIIWKRGSREKTQTRTHHNLAERERERIRQTTAVISSRNRYFPHHQSFARYLARLGSARLDNQHLQL